MNTKSAISSFFIATIATLTLSNAASAAAAGTAAAPQPDPAKVERGRYLVVTAGCNDCHTPLKMGANGPEPDMARLLSGHPQDLVMPPAPSLPPGPWGFAGAATMTAWAGPWGVSFTRNLTPDPETGIGSWSEQDFLATVRSGRHLGRGRALLPPMPWQNVAAMTDDDIKAIYAYLRTIPPIVNRVPEPIAPPAPPAAK